MGYLRTIQFAALALLGVGCANLTPPKSVERLDERSGMTVAAMPRPLGFAETGLFDLLVPDKQPSIVYLGPVEWDRTGEYIYALWVQVAPGVGGHKLDDLRAPGAFNLKLDDGAVALSALDVPVEDHGPYRPTAPVGQMAYFSIDAALLKRIAASRTLALDLRAADLTSVDFVPLEQTTAALRQFMIDRGLDAKVSP